MSGERIRVGVMAVSGVPPPRLPKKHRISPAPIPRTASILRQIAELLEYNDADTLANAQDYFALRLACLRTRPVTH